MEKTLKSTWLLLCLTLAGIAFFDCYHLITYYESNADWMKERPDATLAIRWLAICPSAVFLLFIAAGRISHRDALKRSAREVRGNAVAVAIARRRLMRRLPAPSMVAFVLLLVTCCTPTPARSFLPHSPGLLLYFGLGAGIWISYVGMEYLQPSRHWLFPALIGFGLCTETAVILLVHPMAIQIIELPWIWALMMAEITARGIAYLHSRRATN
ncbi:hypothetical protein KQI84_08405 [bacterium]|nr:hypothetical protein [bacterium]